MATRKSNKNNGKIVKVRNIGTVEDFSIGERVTYLPKEADMDEQHEKCEHGEVGGVDSAFIYVVYDNDKNKAIKTNPMYLIHEI